MTDREIAEAAQEAARKVCVILDEFLTATGRIIVAVRISSTAIPGEGNSIAVTQTAELDYGIPEFRRPA